MNGDETPSDVLKESSYYYCVYYDILDDEDCLSTVYRFTTKELAKEFYRRAPSVYVFSDLQYEKERHICGYDKSNPYRPRFSSVEEALQDLQEFGHNGGSTKYKYHHNVFRDPLEDMSRLCELRKSQKLEEEETAALRQRVHDLEKELATLRKIPGQFDKPKEVEEV